MKLVIDIKIKDDTNTVKGGVKYTFEPFGKEKIDQVLGMLSSNRMRVLLGSLACIADGEIVVSSVPDITI